jgi:hypothetical protein
VPSAKRKKAKNRKLTLSYSSKINGYSSTSKKRCDMLLEGNAAHPFGCDSPPIQIVVAVRRPFCLNNHSAE